MWSLTGRLVTGLATAVLAGGLVTLSAQQVSAGTDATTAEPGWTHGQPSHGNVGLGPYSLCIYSQ